MDITPLLPPSGEGSVRKPPLRMDRQFVLLMLNVSVAIVLLVSVLASQQEAKTFTFEWTERLYADDDKIKMSDVALRIDRLYDNNTNLTSAHLGIMLDAMLQGARCNPVGLGSAASSSPVSASLLHWGPHEVSPMCNCLRNIHVEYVKTVNPVGVPLTREDLTAFQPNISAYRDAIQQKCFKKVRPTQVRIYFLD